MGFAIITGALVVGGLILAGKVQDDVQRKKDELYSKYYYKNHFESF